MNREDEIRAWIEKHRSDGSIQRLTATGYLTYLLDENQRLREREAEASAFTSGFWNGWNWNFQHQTGTPDARFNSAYSAGFKAARRPADGRPIAMVCLEALAVFLKAGEA